MQISVRARMFLMGALRQRLGKRKDEARLLNRDLFFKVAIPNEELALYETVIPGVGSVLHPDRIAAAPAINVDLNPAEVRRALTIIDEWDKFGPEDDVWLDPLVEALEKGAKGLA